MIPPSVDLDPLALLLAPPPNETSQQKAARERAEAEARKASEAIDEQIRQEKIALRKKGPVKVLLLGQSESGKSSMIKNFQLRYAPDQWMAKRLSWGTITIVYLNLVRHVVDVLDLLVQAMEASGNSRHSTSSADAADFGRERCSQSSSNNKFSDKHPLLEIRLAPLRSVLTDLGRYADLQSSTNEGGTSSPQMQSEDRDAVMDILLFCKEDMKSLWEDPLVQEILGQRRVRIEDSSSFFLNDIDRIVSRDYEPSDDDVVRARLRSVGVQEHRFTVEADSLDAGREWIMYDLEGKRSSRASWAPFFDDMDVILFFAPISCFDEQLREDRSVNRLEDSLQLWRTVCSSPILAKTQIMLFLNKCDILRNKLRRGVLLKTYVPSFGDRNNDVVTAIKYFQHCFREIFKTCSSQERPFFVHCTSAIDSQAIAATLTVVRESAFRQHLAAHTLV